MAVREIDCLYELCPVPLLKAMKELKTMEVGDVVIIRSDHSCVGANIKEWAVKNQYPVEVVEVEDGEWEVYIEKTK
ncbi:sulfurtransferase TusA family protein [Crassaminicella profunda]|uniref:sulfurtransferase TusA family protein n=1 Tax=Crassaminicella profunda TaxID=1286698 RepID=UPI001CA75F2E|nr:sulfurtransferase TusA family protein [Crassaminicella profunda]QZY53851.1 sulfurtransferase TusA family protein [Crassaminicella profunda]